MQWLWEIIDRIFKEAGIPIKVEDIGIYAKKYCVSIICMLFGLWCSLFKNSRFKPPDNICELQQCCKTLGAEECWSLSSIIGGLLSSMLPSWRPWGGGSGLKYKKSKNTRKKRRTYKRSNSCNTRKRNARKCNTRKKNRKRK